MDPSAVKDLVEKANALHAAGKKLEAAPMYVDAARAFPPYASFGLVAGDSYAAAGRLEEAAAAYRVCLAGHPDHDEAWQGLAKALVGLGRTDAETREACQKGGVPVPGAARPGLLKRWFGTGS